MLCILNDILDFSKIEAGKLSVNIVAFVLRELLDEVKEYAQLMLKKKENVKFVCECVEVDQDLKVVSDPGRIKQVIMNMVGNANRVHQGRNNQTVGYPKKCK